MRKNSIIFLIIMIIVLVISFIFINKEKNNIARTSNRENVYEQNIALNEEDNQNIVVSININNAQQNEATVEKQENEVNTENTIRNQNTAEGKEAESKKTENKKVENKTKENKIVGNKTTNKVSEKENKEENKKSKNKTIAIDPGHQTKGDSSKEPIGPGATETKAKVTTGATGVSTKQTESELNLKVALKLESELKQRGYRVVMTRTTNNVNISNIQRAEIANNSNADAFIRIHADSVDNETVNRNVYIMPNFTK